MLYESCPLDFNVVVAHHSVLVTCEPVGTERWIFYLLFLPVGLHTHQITTRQISGRRHGGSILHICLGC